MDFSGPLFNAARLTVQCQDEDAARDTANALNDLFTSRGSDGDNVRAGVRAFSVGNAVDEREYVDELVNACSAASDLETLPAGRRILIGARLDPRGQYGADVVRDMSGEALGGEATPILDLQIAQIDVEGLYASIESHAVPMTDWTDLPSSESGFSPFFRFDAVEQYGFTISNDGARSHSAYDGLANGVDIPCDNIEAGRAVLTELRDRL